MNKVVILIFLCIFFAFIKVNAQQSVGIGTNTPNPRSVLELVSLGQNQGFLLPRLNTTEIASIAVVPSDRGLMVFDNLTNEVKYWNGSIWLSLSNSGSIITNLNGLTNGTQTFATGTTGTNFNINSVGSTHTFNFPNASAANRGLLTSADWTTFNNKQSTLTIGNVTTSTTGLSITGGTGSVIGAGTTINIQNANGTQPGLLTAADWTTFNNKQGALTTGNVTTSTTGLSITGGTGSVIGAGATINIQNANGTQPGLLTAADWTTFNNKLGTALNSTQIWVGSAGNVATARTMGGDATLNNTGILTIANNAITSAKIADGTIVNADVNAAAAVDGTKISPNFGNQLIQSSAGASYNVGGGGNLTGQQVIVSGSSGNNFGIVSSIIGLAAVNTGLRGEASNATTNYGIYGNATGSIGDNYGIYGRALNGVNNWAGFFEGNVGLTGALGVGATPNFGSAGQVLTSSGAGLPPTWAAAGGGWGLSGNAGTVPGTNFIGTTDNIALRFRTNNADRLTISNTGNVGINGGSASSRLFVNEATSQVSNIGTFVTVSNATSTNTGNYASVSGVGTSQNFAFDGQAIGGQISIGIRGSATGASSSNWGISGQATGAGLINYGVYAFASGAGTNWSVYSDGHLNLQGGLAVGGTNNFGLSGQVLSSNGAGLSPSWTNPSSLGWSLLGNAGTVDGTNYIGTSDNVPFTIRTNNIRSARLEPAVNGNAFFGFEAGLSVPNNSTSTAIGYQALRTTAVGSQNTAIGYRAMNVTNNAIQNVAVGMNALLVNTTGSQNTAVGYGVMSANTDGLRNVAMGMSALNANTSGDDNVSVGYQSLLSNSLGNFNVGIGSQALQNTNASNNVAIGVGAGAFNAIGTNNTFLGSGANASVNNLTNATAIGANAIVTQSNTLVLGNGANVGIGTSSPLARLDVLANTNSPTLASINGIVASLGGQRLRFSTGDVLDIGFQQSPTYAAWFQAGFNGTAESILLNPLGGNVGIGTNDPTAQLHTTGGVRFAGFTGPGVLTVDASGNVSSTSGSAIVGSGLINRLTYWNTGSTIAAGSNLGWDNANENLGVGWPAPERNLHLHRASGADVLSKYTNTNTFVGAGNGFEVGILAAGDAIFRNMEPTSMQFHTSNIERMRISNTGNVGIGTTAPNARLSIGLLGGTAASTTFSTNAGVLGTGALNELSLASIGFNSGNQSSFSIRALRQVAGTDWTTTAIVLGMDVDNTVRAGGSLLAISNNGNIGIGTTAPNAPLQFSNGLANRKVVLWEGANNDHQYFGFGINSNTLRYQVNNTADNHVFFAGTSTSSSNELMRITGTGRLGIGTNAPNSLIDIVGTSTAPQNIINMTSANTWGTAINIGNSTSSTAYQLVTAGSAHPTLASGSFALSSLTSGNLITVDGSSGDMAIGALAVTTNKIGLGTDPIGTSKVYVSNSENSFSDGMWLQQTRANGSTMYGLYNTNANNTGSTNAFGIYNSTSGTSTGPKYGVYSTTGGSGIRYAFYGVGNAFLTGGTTWTTSDERLKNNIVKFDNALSILSGINTYNYTFKRDGLFESFQFPEGNQFGFLASELEKVLPSFVHEADHPVPADLERTPGQQETSDPRMVKFKAVNYQGMIPILTQAIKEQQEQIELLRQQVEELLKKP
jgi:hypothetical protein